MIYKNFSIDDARIKEIEENKSRRKGSRIFY